MHVEQPVEAAAEVPTHHPATTTTAEQPAHSLPPPAVEASAVVEAPTATAVEVAHPAPESAVVATPAVEEPSVHAAPTVGETPAPTLQEPTASLATTAVADEAAPVVAGEAEPARELGWEDEDAVEKPRGPRNPNLSLDRNKSRSVGGLARDDDEAGCCGCVVA